MSNADYKKEAMVARIIKALDGKTEASVAFFNKYEKQDTIWHNQGHTCEDTMVCFVQDVLSLNPEHCQKLSEEDVLSIDSWVPWKEVYHALNPTTISGGSFNATDSTRMRSINLIDVYLPIAKDIIDCKFFTMTATSRKTKDGWVAVLNSPKGEFIVPIETNYQGVRLSSLIAQEIKRSHCQL